MRARTHARTAPRGGRGKAGRGGAGGPAADLDGVVGAGDERDEEAEHHVDEQADEGVQVELGEQPDQAAAALLRLHRRERHEHVIAVDEREEALGHHGQRAELPAGRGVGGQRELWARLGAGVGGSEGAAGMAGGWGWELWGWLLHLQVCCGVILRLPQVDHDNNINQIKYCIINKYGQVLLISCQTFFFVFFFLTGGISATLVSTCASLNQLLVSLIFAIVFFVSISFISALILISFLLLTLG